MWKPGPVFCASRIKDTYLILLLNLLVVCTQFGTECLCSCSARNSINSIIRHRSHLLRTSKFSKRLVREQTIHHRYKTKHGCTKIGCFRHLTQLTHTLNSYSFLSSCFEISLLHTVLENSLRSSTQRKYPPIVSYCNRWHFGAIPVSAGVKKEEKCE